MINRIENIKISKWYIILYITHLSEIHKFYPEIKINETDFGIFNTILNIFITLIISLAAFIGIFIFTKYTGLYSTVFSILLLFPYGLASLTYLNTKYSLDEDGIVISHGILSKNEIFIPYNNITNLFVSQSFIEKKLNVGYVYISLPKQRYRLSIINKPYEIKNKIGLKISESAPTSY